MENIDTKKVGKFLKSLNESEFMYMRHCADLSASLRKLVRDGMSKEEFCKKFYISPKKYKDFLLGNCNYDLKAVACLEAVFNEIALKKMQEHQVVKVEE